jgi:phosphatidate cytidylyltransferase
LTSPSLGLRAVSGAVLAAYGVASVLGGWPWYAIMVFAGGAMMGWEWGRLCGGGRHGAGGTAVTLLVAAIGFIGIFGYFDLALAIGALGLPLVWLLARSMAEPSPVWQASGMVWIAGPVLSMHYVFQGDPVHGQFAGGWVMLIAFASDIGAYFGGRWIGGPKLAPRISPAKTWAGLAGGIVTAVAVAVAAAWIYDPALLGPAFAGAVILGSVAPLGDLFESHVKRRFRVKDSSGVIPGHGGALDRFDGLGAAMLVAALFAAFNEGSIWLWQ